MKKKPQIMGILNITKDSFSDGGDFFDPKVSLEHTKKMMNEGVDILDIGAESTHPDSEKISAEEEWRRLSKILSKIEMGYNPLMKNKSIKISIDTYKSYVVQKIVEMFGYETYSNMPLQNIIINDISAFRKDPEIKEVLKNIDCEIVLVFSKDSSLLPTKHQQTYNNPIQEIGDFFEQKLQECEDSGIDPKRIIIDPGMGFFLSSDPQISFYVLKNLQKLKKKFPENKILVGTSRKSFLGTVSDPRNPKNRLIASITSSLLAVQNGADIIRVHDVKETKEAMDTFLAIQNAA